VAGIVVLDFEFFVDEPIVPSFTQSPVFDVINSTTIWFSGVLYYASGQMTTDFAASGVVSYFMSASGLAKLQSENLECVVDRGIDVEQANSIRTFALVAGLRGHTTFLNAILTIYNSVGQSVDSAIALPFLVDTVHIANTTQVTSGTGLYPPSGTFGLAMNMQQSLVDNVELMFVGGTYQIPYAVNYTTYQPSGSPDYTSVNDGVSMRYSTFKYSLSKICGSLYLHFRGQTGSGWGNDQETGEKIVFQARFTGPMDSGWLDCNAFYDGVGIPSGDGSACLLSSGTSYATKHITLGGQTYDGEVYLRVGIDCQNNMSKTFSAIDISIEQGQLASFCAGT
jgi:hypothetical protein